MQRESLEQRSRTETGTPKVDLFGVVYHATFVFFPVERPYLGGGWDTGGCDVVWKMMTSAFRLSEFAAVLHRARYCMGRDYLIKTPQQYECVLCRGCPLLV